MYDNLRDDSLVWLMCKCYVHPLYAKDLSFPLNEQGHCGRCKQECGLLTPDDYQTREQAEECFKENYGYYPIPLDQVDEYEYKALIEFNIPYYGKGEDNGSN